MPTKTFEDLIQLGDPVEHRGVVIAPVFPRRQPQAGYITLEEALPLGFHVTEVDAAGSVPELVASNPLESNVLLYDGEELVGAKQNRILNVTVLVPAQSEIRIPVSCVEEGRWSARSARFSAARHTAYPELRRRKAEMLSVDPLALGAAQAAVWDEVSAKADRLQAQAPTRAQSDIFRSREREVGELRRAFPLVPGQAGAVLALGESAFALDYVSQPVAFARLYPKLLDGYLLDAIERLDGKPARVETLESFVGRLESAPRSRRASAGLGEDVRLRGEGVVGSGLELEGELIQLCAFSRGDEPAGGRATRIMRPSRRA
jgi:ARG/rhodanese/phosphatase superfamily protein